MLDAPTPHDTMDAALTAASPRLTPVPTPARSVLIHAAVLALALLRLLWRATHAPPPLPRGFARWERRGAHAAHWALYALIIALPLSGWLHDSAWNGGATHPISLYGVIPWFRIGWLADLDPKTKHVLHVQLFAVHVWLGYVLYAVVALHVAGALKHQLLDREPELQRMLPEGKSHG